MLTSVLEDCTLYKSDTWLSICPLATRTENTLFKCVSQCNALSTLFSLKRH